MKSALVARLQADATVADGNVLVSYGLPNAPTRELPREWVYTGNTREDDPTRGGSPYGAGQTSAALGNRKREERYVLEIVVSVVKGSLEVQQAVVERAFTIAAGIENSIRTWGDTSPNAFSGVVRWALVTGLYHKEGAEMGDGGSGNRFCDVYIDVACSARI